MQQVCAAQELRCYWITVPLGLRSTAQAGWEVPYLVHQGKEGTVGLRREKVICIPYMRCARHPSSQTLSS